MSLKNSLERLKGAIQMDNMKPGLEGPCPMKKCYSNLPDNEGVSCFENIAYYVQDASGGCRLYTTSNRKVSKLPCNNNMHSPMCQG